MGVTPSAPASTVPGVYQATRLDDGEQCEGDSLAALVALLADAPPGTVLRLSMAGVEVEVTLDELRSASERELTFRGNLNPAEGV